MLFKQIIIDVIQLPFDAIGIDHSELALIRIAAVHLQSLPHRNCRAFDPEHMLRDRLA
jgi:hypothetical protein